MTDEIQLLRELGGEIPPAYQGLIRDIYERATCSETRLFRLARPRYAVVLVAVTAAAAAAIALPIALGNSGASHDPSPPESAAGPGSGSAGKLYPNTVVSSVDEANALLPFEAVLPSNAVPTAGIGVSASDVSGGITANFDTTDAGSYLFSQYSSDATVETLQQWAAGSAEGCLNDSNDCTGQIVTEDGVHVLVVESPVFGLRLQWLRDDGASPVMTELDWRRDMPANNVVPSWDAALAIAGDIIRQGG